MHTFRPLRLLAPCLLALCGCGRPDAPTPPSGAPTPAVEPAAVQGAAPGAAPSTPTDAAALVAAAAFDGPVLPDLAAERGLVHVNESGRPDKPTILEANGAGVALLDLGGDGDLDVAFGQGVADLATLLAGPGADLALFENRGDGTFTPLPGPGLAGWWTGLATGDVDGDGRTDLVAGGYGCAAVLLQRDGGRFEVVAEPGLLAADGRAPLVPGAARAAGAPPTWITSLALFDADRDGRLDLYLCCYLDLDPVAPPLGELGEGVLALPCEWKGHQVYCGPRGMVPQADRLLLGRGDGTFVDASERLRGALPGFSLGVAPFDADGDGDTDVYVAADSVPNQLFVNDGTGWFDEVGTSAGVAVNQEGMAEAGMGVAVGDVDRDGRMDLVVTNFSDEATQLYLGADVGFRTHTYRAGLQQATRRLLSWGVHLSDFDADGRLELFTANGHVYPQADAPDTGTRYAQPDTLWRFDARLRVAAVEPGGPTSVLALERGTRGSAVGDVDGDGAPDLVLSAIDAPAALGHNTFGRARHRVELRLEGRGPSADGTRASPRDGSGARIVVVPKWPADLPASEQFAVLGEVQTASGYQSASSPWPSFGLGTATEYSQIQVLWPSGTVDVLPEGAGGRRLFVREGEGLVKAEEFVR
jgi:hypothetical protein